MDGGGSNSSRHYLFKQDLQAVADEIGIEIRVAHFPPYTSKGLYKNKLNKIAYFCIFF